ncbi:MAG: hypothetical protein EOP83_11365 [Verrucomicrobiaceae bacterium]|nr:MAG: hypothetical protein EOP83_11365 [Verrucomicrobiaceae bacterium]
MLIQPKSVLAPNDIAALKLISSEEVVGRVVSVDENQIVLSRPVIAQMQMVGPNDARLGFAPMLAIGDELANYTFEFSKLIFSPSKARKDIADAYTTATSGIVPAKTVPNGILPNGFAQ